MSKSKALTMQNITINTIADIRFQNQQRLENNLTYISGK